MTTTTTTTTTELQVKISERQEGTETWYEGTVSICGLKPTKLARKSDGSTRFATRSSLTGAARTLATSLGYQGVASEQPKGVASEQPKRVAAKKSATSTKSATKKSSSSPTN